MRIQEAARTVGCTCRAIKFYEEKHLLPPVARLKNGYRDYTDADLVILNEIQFYRKLGISVEDIRRLLSQENRELLSSILENKQQDLNARQKEIAALEALIAGQSMDTLLETVDFPSIASAIRAQLPGFLGAYLCVHFAPYLDTSITTPEQLAAYRTVLAFWDNPRLRLPVSYRLIMLAGSLVSPQTASIDESIKSMLNPSEDEYARIKAQTLRHVRLHEHMLIRFSPPEVFKRSMMRRLRNCGYYDVFIPAMEQLSPSYKAYKDALRKLNDRMCRELNLYYDSDFNLRMHKFPVPPAE